MTFQMFKLVLEKAEEPEIKLPTFSGSSKQQESLKNKTKQNIYFCFIDYAKAFDCVDHKKLWKILKEMGIPDHLTCFLIHKIRSQHIESICLGKEKEIASVESKLSVVLAIMFLCSVSSEHFCLPCLCMVLAPCSSMLKRSVHFSV